MNDAERLPDAPGAVGFRPNVAMAIGDGCGRLLLAERPNGGWQLPQGGIAEGESSKQAMYREMEEETGLKESDVELISTSRYWHSYRVPAELRNRRSSLDHKFVGQTQRWFLLLLHSGDDAICLDQGPYSEFVRWRWVPYWYPLSVIVPFKRAVYCSVLHEFAVSHTALCISKSKPS